MKKAKGVFFAALALAFVFAIKPLADSAAYNASSYISGFNIGGILVNNASSGTVNLNGATDFSAVPFEVKTSNIPRSLFAVHSDDNVIVQNAVLDLRLSGSSGIAAVLSEGAMMYVRYGQQTLFSLQPIQIQIMRSGSFVDITNTGFSAADMVADSVQLTYNFSFASFELNNQNFNVLFSFSGGQSQTAQNSVSINIDSLVFVANVTENSDASQEILDVIETTPPGQAATVQAFLDSFVAFKNDLENRSSAFFAAANDAITSINTMLTACGTEIGTYFDAVVYPFSQVELVTEAGGAHLNVLTIIISICFAGYLIGLFRLFLGLMDDDNGKKKK